MNTWILFVDHQRSGPEGNAKEKININIGTYAEDAETWDQFPPVRFFAYWIVNITMVIAYLDVCR